MKTLKSFLASRLARFWRRQDGLMAAEFVLVLPLFMFCTISMYSYWDAFRSLNTVQKASYTVSDMIARTMLPVNDAYLLGLRNTMQYMVGPTLPVNMRISSVTFSALRNRYEIGWSRVPGGGRAVLTTATLQPLVRYIPTIEDGTSVIVLETTTRFKPLFARADLFGLFLDESDFQQFIVTPPRWLPKVCLTGVAC